MLYDERKTIDTPPHKVQEATALADGLADSVRVAGVTSTKAQAIAQAMAAGSVRHVSVEF